MSVDLPEPDTPVTQQKVPTGMAASMPCRLLPAAPRMTICLASVGRHALGGDLDAQLPGQVAAGQRGRIGGDLVRRALGHQLAAVDAGAGPQVHDVVGGADGVLVVLDDDDAVADVAQPGQRGQEPLVVALVQADGGLVEHVHDADQPGADLAREPDALRLAAGEVSALRSRVR
jgi:hypothetical protein